MKQICIVTGGGSGIGLETAKLLGKEQKIILIGRTASKLKNALNTLLSLGIEAELFPCDVSDREAVDKVAQCATSQGTVKTVIHAAGVSPHMADAETIFKINAIGTINMNEVFGSVMSKNSCIINVSSMSGHLLPEANVPLEIYKKALEDVKAFEEAFGQMISTMPKEQSRGRTYTISKNFVIWYTAKMAIRYGKRGIRVTSISPGTFNTPMGELEGKEAMSFALDGALGRIGEPEEIAKMIAVMAGDECSYLTGTDILYDGGAIAAFKDRRAQK